MKTQTLFILLSWVTACNVSVSSPTSSPNSTGSTNRNPFPGTPAPTPPVVIPPIPPSCGSANGETFIQVPTADLCAVGTASAAILSSSSYSWTCVGASGTNPVTCSAAQAATIGGPLRSNLANPRYFSDASGKAILLTGAHTWDNFLDTSSQDPPPPFNYSAYLDYLKNVHHNFIRLWTWEQTKFSYGSSPFSYINQQPWRRSGSSNALDGKPKFDLSQFDQPYFDRLKQHVQDAGNRGIYVSIMLFEGHGVQWSNVPWNWNGHPFNAQNNLQGWEGGGLAVHTLSVPANLLAVQENYVKKVIDTVNSFDNVLYEISNETDLSSVSWQYHMIALIHNYENQAGRKKHPVGMTSLNYGSGESNNSNLTASAADWISPYGVNSYQDNMPVNNGSKVVLLDTDHIFGIGGDSAWVWKSVTRGYNPLYMDPYNGADGKTNMTTVRNMGYALTFAEKMNLKAMTPQSNLASSGYCLANVGAEYLVFLPGAGTVSVNLASATGTFNVEWLNPANGAKQSGAAIAGGASRSLTAPFSGSAVLYLKK